MPIIREALARAISEDPRIVLAGAHATTRELLDQIAVTRVDVVMLDLGVVDGEAAHLVGRIRQFSPTTRILGLVAVEQPTHARLALQAGVDGCITKGQGSAEVLDSIVAVDAGTRVLAPQVARAVAGQSAESAAASTAIAQLREYDLDIIRRVVSGQTDDEIASQLYISTRTVQNHLARIRKLAGVRRRAELASWAVTHALV